MVGHAHWINSRTQHQPTKVAPAVLNESTRLCTIHSRDFIVQRATHFDGRSSFLFLAFALVVAFGTGRLGAAAAFGVLFGRHHTTAGRYCRSTRRSTVVSCVVTDVHLYRRNTVR